MSKDKNYELGKYYPFIFTILFVYILIQYPFYSLEAFFYDLRARFDFGVEKGEDVVLVVLDETSDDFLGERYPYTYSTHSKLVEKVVSYNPIVINYLVRLEDPTSQQEFQEQIKFKNILMNFVESGGAFHFGTEMDDWGEHLPPEYLRNLGYSLALLHLDSNHFAKDDVCRRTILNISGEDSLHLWAANKFRKWKGEGDLSVKDIIGSYFSSEADATFTLFRYIFSPLEKNNLIKKIPFHEVITGNFPPDFFKNRIVIVGPQYISLLSDYLLTPFNRDSKYIVPKINVHANVIESLIQNKTILQVPRYISNILAFLLAIILSFLISKLSPTKGLFVIIATMLGIFILSFIAFSKFNLWIYITHLIFVVFIVYYIWVPFRAIAEYQGRYAIEEEAKLLKEVDHLKQNFLSLVSHDLRTPLAKLAGLVEILKKQIKNKEEHDLLLQQVDRMGQTTSDLDKFISSILDLTKMESQKFKLNKISKDINTIIEAVICDLSEELKIREMILEKKLEPLFPISIDVSLAKRVLANLLENAIKYSGSGATVKVSSWEDENWIYVEIADNGIGIDQQNLERIFDKFYRIQNEKTHSIKGTGLGLYLVKYFVELHEGKISVNSQLGKGTTFLVQFKNA